MWNFGFGLIFYLNHKKNTENILRALLQFEGQRFGWEGVKRGHSARFKWRRGAHFAGQSLLENGELGSLWSTFESHESIDIRSKRGDLSRMPLFLFPFPNYIDKSWFSTKQQQKIRQWQIWALEKATLRKAFTSSSDCSRSDAIIMTLWSRWFDFCIERAKLTKWRHSLTGSRKICHAPSTTLALTTPKASSISNKKSSIILYNFHSWSNINYSKKINK